MLVVVLVYLLMNIYDAEEFVYEFILGDEEIVSAQHAEGLVDQEKLAVTRSLDYCLVFDAQAIEVIVDAVLALLDIHRYCLLIFRRVLVFLTIEILAQREYVRILSGFLNLVEHFLENVLHPFTLYIIDFLILDTVRKHPILNNLRSDFNVLVFCYIWVSIHFLGYKISLVLIIVIGEVIVYSIDVLLIEI